MTPVAMVTHHFVDNPKRCKALFTLYIGDNGMGLMYMFVSEQEKNYRRSDLHDKFCSIFCDFFENDEEEFVNFLNGITCIVGYSKDRKSTGFGSSSHMFLKRFPQYVDLSRLLYL